MNCNITLPIPWLFLYSYICWSKFSLIQLPQHRLDGSQRTNNSILFIYFFDFSSSTIKSLTFVCVSATIGWITLKPCMHINSPVKMNCNKVCDPLALLVGLSSGQSADLVNALVYEHTHTPPRPHILNNNYI